MSDYGVVFIRFRPYAEVEPTHAKEISSAADRISRGKRHANLVDVRGLRYMSKETRDAFARQRSSMVAAIAVLVASSLQQAMGNLYLTVSRPVIPTRLFSSEELAIDWLREQCARADDAARSIAS